MAAEPGDDTFVSTLTEDEKKKAREELNERNDEDRKLAVQTLRQWIQEQGWLKTPTDFAFLLRFLRVRKFSQLGARETVGNYWTNRTETPQWFKNVDPAEEGIQGILRSGFCIAPLQYDKFGRRICFFDIGKMDFSQFGVKSKLDTLYRTTMIIMEWLAYDEKTQVNGLCTMNDYSGLSIGVDVLKVWNREYSKKSLAFYQNSLPMRFKGFHLYKEPPFLDGIFAVMKPFMKKKMLDRTNMHGKSLVGVYEEFGMHVFPDEYLPDDYDGPSAGPAKMIVENMIEDIMKPEFRNYIKEISSDKYGVDLSLKPKSTDAPAASFRRLNID